MADAQTVALSLVERGWQVAREWSLAAQRRDITVVHVIKGRLRPSVQAMITPRPNIHIVSVPRALFWVDVFGRLLASRFHGRLRTIVVDNDRSRHRLERWTRWMGVELLSMQASVQGCEGRDDAGRAHL